MHVRSSGWDKICTKNWKKWERKTTQGNEKWKEISLSSLENIKHQKSRNEKQKVILLYSISPQLKSAQKIEKKWERKTAQGNEKWIEISFSSLENIRHLKSRIPRLGMRNQRWYYHITFNIPPSATTHPKQLFFK